MCVPNNRENSAGIHNGKPKLIIIIIAHRFAYTFDARSPCTCVSSQTIVGGVGAVLTENHYLKMENDCVLSDLFRADIRYTSILQISLALLAVSMRKFYLLVSRNHCFTEVCVLDVSQDDLKLHLRNIHACGRPIYN